MRAVKSSGTSQKAIANQSLILGFAATKVKNTFNFNTVNSKLTQKLLLKQTSGDQSDASTETSESILPSSKKIQKLRNLVSTAKSSKKVNNQSGLRMALRSSKVFLEDGTKLSRNYTIIDYKSTQTKESYRFPCFPDFDLGIPTGYSEKLRAHSCDNDCSTDDDQIKSAIKTLYNSLKEAVQEEKETGNSKKKSKKH